MKLYLVQHGLALDAAVDPQRPLSEEGRHQVQKVAWALNRAALRPTAVYHSGKLRAAQTAELLATELGLEGAEPRKHLTPKADPQSLVAALGSDSALDGAMLVGHQPHLGRLLGHLLGVGEQTEAVRLRNAAVLCLVRDDGRWAVDWYLTPAIC